MSSLSAIAQATAILALGATSVSGQVYRGNTTARPVTPPTTQGATLERPLPAPTNLTVTPAGTSASLRWDPVPGATGYLISRTSALYGTIQQTPTPITSTSFTDGSQQFDPRYLHTYKVNAVYPDGRASASSVTYAPPPASVSYPLYSGNRYSTGAGWTTKWTAVPEATGYVVRYSMQMTNGLNAYWTVDTSISVAAPTTSHYVTLHNGTPGANGPSNVYSAAVSAVFPNGERSVAKPAGP